MYLNVLENLNTQIKCNVLQSVPKITWNANKNVLKFYKTVIIKMVINVKNVILNVQNVLQQQFVKLVPKIFILKSILVLVFVQMNIYLWILFQDLV